MKIESQTENELVIREGGELFGIIVGLVFLSVGGYFIATSGSISGNLLKGVFLPGILLVVGALFILFSSSTGVAFQKTQGKIVFSKKRLIGTNISEYNIADVLRVELRKQWQIQQVQSVQGGSSMPEQVLVSQTIIVFKDGNEVAIDKQNSSQSTTGMFKVLMGGQGKELALARQIAEFINVPFQEILPPNQGIGLDLGSIGKMLR